MAYTRTMNGKVPQVLQELHFDETPTPGSLNPVTSGGVAEVTGKTSSNIAEAFSASSTYAIGEVVIGPDGKLYQCTTAVETAGEWDPEDWDETSLGDILFTSRGSSNIEVRKSHCKVGDAVYADSDGNVHFIAGKSVTAESIPQEWTFVGAVAIRTDSKVKILYKSTNSSKWINCWLFKISGLKLDGTDTMVMQQGRASGTGAAIEVGTFTASEAATDLDTFVDELNTWLLANPTAEGAYANYGWHAAKMKDAEGVDACFVIVDNAQNQTITLPVKSSTSGANSEFYNWQYAGFTEDSQTCRRKDGVMTYAVVWNKDRFKEYNTNINNPTDSLTTTGLFNEASFDATTVVKEHYGTYDNYLNYMMADESSEDGVFGYYGNFDRKEVTTKLAAVKYTPISGSESPVFPAESFAASIDAGAEGLGAGDFYVPSISEAYEILSQMKTDGSDFVNLTLTSAGASAISLSTGTWIPARWNYYGTWRFENTGALYAFSLFAVYRTIAIAELDVTE